MPIAGKVDLRARAVKDVDLTPAYASRHFTEPIPKYEIPEKMMPADVAYQLIRDELNLDGPIAFDLGSFTATWMEPEAERLMTENLGKNFIDRFEYPQTSEIHRRIVNMLGRMFSGREGDEFQGTATIGSSEAIMLGLLAHKWTWKRRRQERRQSIDRPNLVYSAAAHVCWDKFAKYFDVECRRIDMGEGRFVIDPAQVAGLVDENTICVGAIVGTTFTGAIEPVAELDAVLARVEQERGWSWHVPIHVDAASGGFIVPFTDPGLAWDFRVPRVRSVNVSGHKFGLVYPGLGWLVFKDKRDLPEELIFYVNYLGATEGTYTLNFSRGADTILGQYYNLLRLGREGYARVMRNCLLNAAALAKGLADSGKFEVVSDGKLPIVAFRFVERPRFTPFQLSSKLRERGWMLPAYQLPVPDHAQDPRFTVMRVVVRESLSRDLVDNLVSDLTAAYDALVEAPPAEAAEPPAELRARLAI